MPGRLVHKADFERVLAQKPCGRSAHFALHHLAGPPQPPLVHRERMVGKELSTDLAEQRVEAVDDLQAQRWIGTVLPKRMAKRAVTRNLIRRAIYASAHQCGDVMAPGMWVVRLRAPFTTAQYPSAASQALRAAASAELEGLLCASRR